MTTVATRNLYIDSEISQGNGLSFRLNLPPSSFCCKPNQVMKLTMSNFEIRKNWYEVNQTNNVFWIKLTNASVSKYFPIAIPPGSYRAFGTTATSTAAYNSAYSYATNDLCSAIAYGINKTLRSIHEKQAIFDWTGLTTIGTGTDVDYRIYQADTEYSANEVFGAGESPATVVSFNSVTRKFTMTITVPVAGYTIDQIIFLQVKHGIPVAHPMNRFVATFNRARYGEAAFQDSYELLGGVPTRDSEISNNSVADGNTISANKFVSPYVGQLNTLEAIYVRLLSASTNNFQSPGLDKNVPNNYGLVPTNIFARCPLPGAIYDDAIEILTYTEKGRVLSLV